MTIKPRNEVLLEGVASAAPEWSHQDHGIHFYRFFLQVPRLSGTPDVLPVLPEDLAAQVAVEQSLRLEGQLRSFNNRSGVGSRLVLSVYAQHIYPGGGPPQNHISLSGVLCKPPVFRRTPLGRSICDLMLAAPALWPCGLSSGHRLGTAGRPHQPPNGRGPPLPGGADQSRTS